MLLSVALAADVFFSHGPYEVGVPKPETILGYGPGDRHTYFMDQERYVQALVNGASGRVRIFPYGKSWEGRPLRVLAISTPENIKKLEKIRADIQTLADGTIDESVIKSSPCIVWINETIHGNETASFESGMWLAYNLAASKNPEIVKALEKAVVIVNPCYNPDGHERTVVWYNSVARGDADPDAYEPREPRIIGGRGNHYRFDMNRDRLAMSQAETRGEVGEFLRWNPQVYADQHGQVETYFFPPTAMSVNKNVRERYNKWTDVIGRATGKAFDKHGFAYYIKDIFDFYAPVYLDAWATFAGAIGMTHETNASWRARTDSDGAVRTLRDGMERHFVSALAVIRSSAENREGLLRSFAEFKNSGASGKVAGARKFFVARGTRGQIDRMARILETSKIKHEVVHGRASFEGESLWTGKTGPENIAGTMLIVPMAQPQATLALTLLQTESDFEPEFVKEQLRRRELRDKDSEYAEGEEFYDITGWSLPMMQGVRGWWTSAKPLVTPTKEDAPAQVGDSTIGWAAEPTWTNALAIARLLQSGVRVSQTHKAMKLASGQTFSPGAYLILRSRNDGGVLKKLAGLDAAPLESAYPEEGRYSPGSESVVRLRGGKIGILWGDENSPTSFGGAWYVFEHEFKLPFTAMHNSALRGNLDKYSAILAPEGGVDVSGAKIKEWVQGGGCLVLLGGDPGRGGYISLDKSGGSVGNVPGSLFRAELDPRSFLSYGYSKEADGSIRVASFVGGSSFFKPEGDGSVWTTPDDEEKPLISGWAWPDETEKAVKGAVWAHVQRVGSGRVVWFFQDPTERAMFAMAWPMLINAIVMGPAP